MLLSAWFAKLAKENLFNFSFQYNLTKLSNWEDYKSINNVLFDYQLLRKHFLEFEYL